MKHVESKIIFFFEIVIKKSFCVLIFHSGDMIQQFSKKKTHTNFIHRLMDVIRKSIGMITYTNTKFKIQISIYIEHRVYVI